MADKNLTDKLANRLALIEDNFIEIKSIVEVLNIWVKEKNYELIPVINMLNDKIKGIERVFGKEI